MNRRFGQPFPAGLLMALLLIWLFFPRPAAGIEMTPELLFTQLEERSDLIDSLEAEVELSSGVLRTTVVMAIQSPDKFSMDFASGTIKVVFDGEKIWLYLATLAEVFTLESAQHGDLLSDLLRDWINPRRIITRLSKESLFVIFQITLLPSEKPQTAMTVASGTGPMLPETEARPGSPVYRLRLSPRKESWVTRLFDVGSYEMTFSGEHFLPSQVVEISPQGTPRGRLRVLSYRLNTPLARERFVFQKPEGVKEVPLMEVLAQKVDQTKDLLSESVGRFLKRTRERFGDWGK